MDSACPEMERMCALGKGGREGGTYHFADVVPAWRSTSGSGPPRS